MLLMFHALAKFSPFMTMTVYYKSFIYEGIFKVSFVFCLAFISTHFYGYITHVVIETIFVYVRCSIKTRCNGAWCKKLDTTANNDMQDKNRVLE